MKRIRFLHMADFHYGTRAASEALGLGEAGVRQRGKEERDVLRMIVETALGEKVDIVLLAGDLYDYRATSQAAINEFFDVLRKLENVPVLISPGNHDYYSSHSFYNNDFLLARGQKGVPENVHVFKSASFQTVSPAGIEGVSISSFAYEGFTRSDRRPLEKKVQRDESKINILLLHGWFELVPVERSQQTSPFSLDELEMQNFDYAALGHLHSFKEIVSSSGRLIGAYPGCPFGRGLDEPGERFIIVGEASKGGADIQRVKIDKRAIRKVGVEMKGVGSMKALEDCIKDAVAASKACPEDIVKVTISGRVSPGVWLEIPDDFLKEDFFSIDYDFAEITPDYDIESLLSDFEAFPTTEKKFVKSIYQRIEAEPDAEKKRMLERALYYGLDALRLGEVRPRYEN